MGAWSQTLQTPGHTHPAGGVGGLIVLSHTPACLSTAYRIAPGPRGRGDPPHAGLPVVPAALLPLPLL
jgi:hypothetical protein